MISILVKTTSQTFFWDVRQIFPKEICQRLTSQTGVWDVRDIVASAMSGKETINTKR